MIDDSPAALRLLQAILQDEYDVITASDGIEGLAKVHQTRPDLVITDSVMPGLDGFGLLRRLRENPVTGKIPVIILTAENPRHIPSQADGRLEPDALLQKSENPERLLEEIGRALGRRRRRAP